jgi:hypothetical protein
VTLPAQVAALRKELADARAETKREASLASEALAAILHKLDRLRRLVTKRTAPP